MAQWIALLTSAGSIPHGDGNVLQEMLLVAKQRGDQFIAKDYIMV